MTTGSTELFFGDGRYIFRLNLPHLEELQELSGKGIFRIFQDLANHEWTTGMVRQTIRLGLIGGGLSPEKSADLVRRYVDARPAWVENAQYAWAILGAALIGPEIPGEDSTEKNSEGKLEAGVKPRIRIPSISREYTQTVP